MANKNNSNKNKKTSQGPSGNQVVLLSKKTADTSKVSQASQKVLPQNLLRIVKVKLLVKRKK